MQDSKKKTSGGTGGKTKAYLNSHSFAPARRAGKTNERLHEKSFVNPFTFIIAINRPTRKPSGKADQTPFSLAFGAGARTRAKTFEMASTV